MHLPSIVGMILVTWFVTQGHNKVQAIVPDYCVQRVGCFIDASIHDLAHLYKTGGTSPLSCRDLCKGDHLYAATQVGRECFCDEDFGMYGHRPQLCVNGITCQGYPKYRCGEHWTTDVFMTTKTREVMYLGCFTDDLPHIMSTRTVDFSPIQCASSCREFGFVFSGMKNATVCSCGNTYGSPGDANACDVACLREGDTNCGGTTMTSVYLTGKDDFWQTLAVAHDTYDHLPVHLLLDDSETTCFGVNGGSMADLKIKFSTTPYYQRMTPGVTMLVTMENSACETDGKHNVLAYVDDGAATSGFLGTWRKCSLFETLPEGILNTCVFKCICVGSSCKEIVVSFRKSRLAANTRACEIRSCYSL